MADNRSLMQHLYQPNPNQKPGFQPAPDADRSMVPENHLGSQMEVEIPTLASANTLGSAPMAPPLVPQAVRPIGLNQQDEYPPVGV